MENHHRNKFVIVTPVFNDWTAFCRLLDQLGELPEFSQDELRVIAVDDASSETTSISEFLARKGTIIDVQIIRLACNLGHQRAIAVGLVAASKMHDVDAVVVMDSDGEDMPGDVPRLIAAWREQPDSIVVAQRGSRADSPMFKTFYVVYKFTFRVLTGQTIDFGNFSVIPRRSVEALVHTPSVWNNIAATISRSRIPYRKLQIDRGKRLAGRSRMSFVSLTLHGVSAISVYAEVVIVRVIGVSCALAALALAGMVLVAALKLGTSLAIPGWASYIAAALTIIFFQAVLLAGLAVFQLLSSRSLKPFIPIVDSSIFILSTTPKANNCDPGREV
jgi:polyisoprenyl-phosphate glycosyltransferase